MSAPAEDALLDAWEATLRSNHDRAAVLALNGSTLRTFGDIEAESHELGESLVAPLAPGAVLAIQLGNHESWPALLLACLRRRLIVLPMEATTSPNERDTAMRACGAVAAAVPSGHRITLLGREAGDALALAGQITVL